MKSAKQQLSLLICLGDKRLHDGVLRHKALSPASLDSHHKNMFVTEHHREGCSTKPITDWHSDAKPQVRQP